MPFTWRAGLECQFQIIDKQHRELIEHFSDYIDSISEKTNEVTDRDMLEFLRQYVVDHFWSEEYLMKKFEYPLIHEHTAIHRQYVDDYKHAIAAFKKNKDFQALRNSLRDMLTWFVDHITDDDHKLADFLNNKCKDPKAESAAVAEMLELRHQKEIQLKEGTADRPEISKILANLLWFERGVNEQHRDVIERFAEFQKIDPAKMQVEKVKDMLSYLEQYVAHHFTHEETLMKQYQYPNLAPHTTAHQEYVAAYQQMLVNFKIDHNFTALTEEVTKMLDWFLRHIADFDVSMSFFVKNRALNLFGKKKVVILSQSAALGVEIKESILKLGFNKIMETNEIPKAWEWVREVGTSLLVIAEDDIDFEGRQIITRLRERANDLPILFLTTETRAKELEQFLAMQNRLISQDVLENCLVATRPLNLEQVVRGLDRLIFYYKRGSVALHGQK